MKRQFAAFLFSCLSLTLLAEMGTFPNSPWNELKIRRTPQVIQFVDKKGKSVFNIIGEPGGSKFMNSVVVSQAVDYVSIDARAAFAAGMIKLVMTSSSFDFAGIKGLDAALTADVDGPISSKMNLFFEGCTNAKKHYHIRRTVELRNHRKTHPMIQTLPDDLSELHLRFDIVSQGKGSIKFYRAQYAPCAELIPDRKRASCKPELIFHLPFDGSANAAIAKGNPSPEKENGLSFVPGKMGQAVRITRNANSVLEYALKGNVIPERGTIAFWFKPEWTDKGYSTNGEEICRSLFAFPIPGQRIGSGALRLWWWGSRLRADQSDDEDSYVTYTTKVNGEWQHIAFAWDETGSVLYINGKPSNGRQDDDESPMIRALKTTDELSFDRVQINSFFIGGRNDIEQADGLLDEVCIYSAPLSKTDITELYRKETPVELTLDRYYGMDSEPNTLTVSATSPKGMHLAGMKFCLVDEASNVVFIAKEALAETGGTRTFKTALKAGEYSLRVTNGKQFFGTITYGVLSVENPVLAPVSRTPGVPPMTLVETLTLDKLPGKDRFSSVGDNTFKSLNGTRYLEAGAHAGNRFGIRFRLDKSVPIYCFEIDYPDDMLRTADLIIQQTETRSSAYTMQVGYAAGDEYPNQNKILTHRSLYWTDSDDVTLVVMTARENAPAAISAVRVYKVDQAGLPQPDIHEPKPVNGWNRCFSLYFEDPAIGYDFAADGRSLIELDKMITRTAAYMKFTGQNVFAYPGAWYHGTIGERYNPREHAPHFLQAYYEKFDKEGLFILPTLNQNTMPVPDDLVTRKSMNDGSLYNSVIAIHSTGKPNNGGWHGTPPNFNISHPDVQKYIEDEIDQLVNDGARHPSFKGVCFHLTRHCMLWFGELLSGYNDYTVDAFAKDKGISIPVDRTNPFRGRDYAKWLDENAHDAWVQWRCDLVARFYARIAKKLAERRPDLKLWVNSIIPADFHRSEFTQPGFINMANRECGLDGKLLTSLAPNIILCQALVPADYRWRSPESFYTPEIRAYQKIMDTLPGFYDLLDGADFPWVHQHDRYWESPIGKNSKKNNSLSNDWLKECPWRVTTINPAGYHAMRHFVLPLRYHDILGMSKGGFLIGTYGMEEMLVPFAQAFRALPAVLFDDLPCDPIVKLRHREYDGKEWFYLVNTGDKTQTVTLKVSPKTVDSISGTKIHDLQNGMLTLNLAPYQLRSFCCPKKCIPLFEWIQKEN